jgi:hypothetical protein
VPAFLEQARVGRVPVLESLQRCQRLRDALQVTQRHGAHVEQVAVPGGLLEQAVGGGQGVVEAMLLDQCLQFAQVPFEVGR